MIVKSTLIEKSEGTTVRTVLLLYANHTVVVFFYCVYSNKTKIEPYSQFFGLLKMKIAAAALDLLKLSHRSAVGVTG